MLFKNGHSNISCSTHSSRNLSLPIKRHSLQPLPMYLGSPLCLKERMTEGVWLPRLGQKQWCSSTWCSLSGSQPLCSYEAHGEKLRPPASAPAELAANTDCQLTGHVSESSWEHVLQPPVYVAAGGATWSRNMPSRVSPAQMTNVWAKWMTVVVLSYYVLGNLVCRSR